MIWPARRLADVQVAAVAARDASRAARYAQEHGIPASYGSYSELVADPTLDAIYVATPNGLHGAWAAAALEAGKHVLCEKPFTANAREARQVQQLAARRGLLCREAFHYKEHPANKHVAELIAGGAIGKLKEAAVQVLIPGWAFQQDDIRFNAHLAGGTMMDAGCYCAHALRFFTGQQPSVTSAASDRVRDGVIDENMHATVSYPGGAKGRLHADLRHSGLFPATQFTASGSSGSVTLTSFIVPFFGHTITLTRTDGAHGDSGGGGAAATRATTTKYSVYGSGESNYYYQLQRFVTDLQVLEGHSSDARRRSDVRRSMKDDAADAIDNMQLVDEVYEAAGLPLRKPAAEHAALTQHRG